MKKVISAVAALLVIGGFGWLIYQGRQNQVNYDDYDLWSVLPEDHVKGSREAKVLIFEYADYQCPGCATMWPMLGKVLEEFEEDEVGLVYRNFLLDYHENGKAAASAAEAAAKQGYWLGYANYLFANQSTWEYISAAERESVFSGYFEQVSEGKGDVAQFVEDMKSSAVRKKISFDMGAGHKVGVEETPGIFLNGEKIDFKGLEEDEFISMMRKKINEILDSKE